MSTTNEQQELQRLENAHPKDDLAADIKNGELHFLGIRGYTLTAPGVPDYRDRYANKIPLRIIEGTSDAIASEGERKLQVAATDYAKSYNLQLVKYLETHGK